MTEPKLWLTKAETAKVLELLCPKCKGELVKQEGHYFYECQACNSYFMVDWSEEA